MKSRLRPLPPGLAAFGSPAAGAGGGANGASRPLLRGLGQTPMPKVAQPVRRNGNGTSSIPLYVDLHTHTTASDGTDSPAGLIRRAKAAGLSAVAITDHDTVAGLPEAAAEARRLGIEFLPGIEISAAYPRPGVMHLLGYGFDPNDAGLRRLTAHLQDARHERNEFLVTKLRSVGIEVTFEELHEIARGRNGGADDARVIGRPHFAKLLLIKGYVSHVHAAYRYYLGNTGAFRFDRREPEPAEAIAAVRAAGGVVSLAHPNQLRKQNFAQLASEVGHLASLGLDGVEVIYNDHRESFVAELKDLCRRHDLLMTGGSDFHGSAKRWIVLGRCGNRRRVPRKYYDALLARVRERRGACVPV
ncbi:MAG: PHP domain-containing protein [Planctomycetota bacterium]